MAPNDHDRDWRPFGCQMPCRAFREIGRRINLSQGKARLRSDRLMDTAANARDHLEAQMTPDQIAEAQRLAREWKPRQ